MFLFPKFKDAESSIKPHFDKASAKIYGVLSEVNKNPTLVRGVIADFDRMLNQAKLDREFCLTITTWDKEDTPEFRGAYSALLALGSTPQQLACLHIALQLKTNGYFIGRKECKGTFDTEDYMKTFADALQYIAVGLSGRKGYDAKELHNYETELMQIYRHIDAPYFVPAFLRSVFLRKITSNPLCTMGACMAQAKTRYKKKHDSTF